MKTSIFFSIGIMLTLIGCSGDDTDNETSMLVPRTITYNNPNFNGITNFTYNEEGQLVSYVHSDFDETYKFKYSDTLVSQITVTKLGNSVVFDFEYDEDGKVVDFLQDGINQGLQFDDETNSYTFKVIASDGTERTRTIILDDMGNMVRHETFNPPNNFTQVYDFTYDTTKKGSAFYTNDVFLPGLLAKGNFLNLMLGYNYTKYPLLSDSGTNDSEYQNEYNTDGQLIGSVVLLTNFEPFTITFDYINL